MVSPGKWGCIEHAGSLHVGHQRALGHGYRQPRTARLGRMPPALPAPGRGREGLGTTHLVRGPQGPNVGGGASGWAPLSLPTPLLSPIPLGRGNQGRLPRGGGLIQAEGIIACAKPRGENTATRSLQRIQEGGGTEAGKQQALTRGDGEGPPHVLSLPTRTPMSVGPGMGQGGAQPPRGRGSQMPGLRGSKGPPSMSRQGGWSPSLPIPVHRRGCAEGP